MRYRILKRVVDLCGATAIIVLASPIFVLAALLVLIFEGWPIFYVSRRYVSPTRSIPVFKFRSMVRDALSPRYRLKERFMRGWYLDIPLTCEVYTPIGRVLERTQIVELPQMFNVLLHGMSLIGNRPLPHDNVQLLKRVPGWERRFDSPAGITGIAQVAGKLSLTPDERLGLEIAYSEVYQHGNVAWCDLVIAAYTLRVVLIAYGLPFAEACRLVQRSDPAEDASTTKAADGSASCGGPAAS